MPNWLARLKAMKREALTPQTVTDPKALLARIVADRAQGYSLVDREAEPHFRSISVPVRRYDGVIVAAINMGAHVDRVPAQELIERFLPLLREGAASRCGDRLLVRRRDRSIAFLTLNAFRMRWRSDAPEDGKAFIVKNRRDHWSCSAAGEARLMGDRRYGSASICR